MMLVATSIGIWIGASYNGTVYPLTLTICACGLASAAIAFTLVRRDGDIDCAWLSAVDAVLLLGPTASGKSVLAMQLAERIPLEIVSVDSAQVYRGMDIGTAKPSATDRAAVPHHLIDIRDPADPYSAADFVRDATVAIRQIRARGKLPLLVGGTMLYAKALRDGLSDLPSADPKLRARIEAEAQRAGLAGAARATRDGRPVDRCTFEAKR